MAGRTPLSSYSTLLLSILLSFLVSPVWLQDCPCSWYEVSKAYYCGAQSSVPVSCWALHEGISKVILEGPMDQVLAGDFGHGNLNNMVHLELRGVGYIEDQALTNLTKLVYLNLRHGQLKALPDVSAMNDLLCLEAEGNHINSVPDLTHMTNLNILGLNNNTIHNLADSLLPASSRPLNINFQFNSFRIINASSIITAPDNSLFAFDDLEVIRATQEEADILPTKTFSSNIDLESIVVIIDNPTNP